jgi:hypothetical protein
LSPLFGIWVVVSTNTTVRRLIPYSPKNSRKNDPKKLSYRENMLRSRDSSDCFSQKHALNFSNFSENCSSFPKIRVFRIIFSKIPPKILKTRIKLLFPSKREPKYQISEIQLRKLIRKHRKIRKNKRNHGLRITECLRIIPSKTSRKTLKTRIKLEN